jgi:hypothetical protein
MDEDKDKLIQEASRLRGQGAVVETMFRLKEAITKLDETSTRQQGEIIKLTISIKSLTKVIVILTLIMVIIGIISIWPFIQKLITKYF